MMKNVNPKTVIKVLKYGGTGLTIVGTVAKTCGKFIEKEVTMDKIVDFVSNRVNK